MPVSGCVIKTNDLDTQAERIKVYIPELLDSQLKLQFCFTLFNNLVVSNMAPTLSFHICFIFSFRNDSSYIRTIDQTKDL